MPNTPVQAAAEGLPKNLTPEERMTFHAQQFVRAAMEIDPTVTEWWRGTALDEAAYARFSLIGSRAQKGGEA